MQNPAHQSEWENSVIGMPSFIPGRDLIASALRQANNLTMKSLSELGERLIERTALV